MEAETTPGSPALSGQEVTGPGFDLIGDIEFEKDRELQKLL